jgi:hypothetical protein
MLDPELVAKAIEGRPDALKRYTSSTNGGEYVALGKTDERDRSPAVEGHGGDDGIANHRRPPPRRVPVAMCPGPERRCGDVEVTGCFGCRVERHHETFVVAAHGPDSGTNERRFRDPTPGVIALLVSQRARGRRYTAPGVADGWVMSARRRSGSTTQGPASRLHS